MRASAKLRRPGESVPSGPPCRAAAAPPIGELRGSGDHDKGLAELEPAPTPNGLRSRRKEEPGTAVKFQTEEMTMAWTTPVIVEVCVGMEVTAYSSAEI